MSKSGISQLLLTVLLAASIGAATAQVEAPAGKDAGAAATAKNITTEVLQGAWVRPDGGYLIVIKSVGQSGQLEAMYFNPNPLPFAKAQVSRQGTTLHAFFELQAGGYAGSTYTLSYDPASDQLKGIYYQAVARQKFEVYFARK